MAKKPHTLRRDFDAMIARLRENAKPHRLNEQQRVTLLAMISEGATLTAVCRMDGMPALKDIYYECDCDPEFAQNLKNARKLQATSRIDRAQDMLDEACETNDTDRMRGARIYTEQAIKYAEKIAPQEYGALVKVAGADGGAIQLTIMNYGNGSPQEKENAPRESQEISE